MRERNVRIALVVVDLFAAVSAFAGAVGLLVGYMEIPVSVLNGTPFADFTIPALLLGIVVGGSALVAAIVAAVGVQAYDALASSMAGSITVGYLVVEISLIGLGSWAQAVWLVVGLVMIGLAALLWQAETHAARPRSAHQPV